MSILEDISNLTKNDKKTEKEIVTMARALMQAAEQDQISFPVEAFPPRITSILKVFTNCYGLPVDYFGLGILTTAATVIGNSYVAKYKFNQEYPAILYSAIVGNSSIGKTPAINICLRPLFKIEEEYNKKYKEDIESWKQECFELSLTNTKAKEPPKPSPKEIILNDTTTEAINYSLSKNPRGLLLFKDELSGWINSLNQYRKGSDTEFYLSNWSNQTAKVSRAGKDPILIKKPFVNVIGGIQPGILHQLAGDGRTESGFLARVLFAYPDEMKKPYESDILPDRTVFETYKEIIHYLHDLPTKITPPQSEYEDWTVESVQVDLEDEARMLYKAFFRENTDAINETEEDTIKSIYGKMENYCMRFALILELLDLAVDQVPEYDKHGHVKKEDPTWRKYSLKEMEKLKISSKSVERAITLINYFKRTAFKVIQRFESPVFQLPKQKQVFYQSLPEEFERKVAVEAGEALDMSVSTVKRLLNDKQLFKRLGRGRYEKAFI